MEFEDREDKRVCLAEKDETVILGRIDEMEAAAIGVSRREKM